MSDIKISGFYDEASGDLRTQCELIKKLGEHYLCPRVVNGKNISAYTVEEFEKDVKPVLDEYGIKFSSIGSPIGKVGLYDEEGYQAQIKKLQELVKIAKVMDCKYIRIFSFRVDKKGDYDAYFPEVVKKLRGYLDVVKGTDIVLLHENEKGIYGDVPDRVMKLYKEINDPQFQLCFDASNYIQCDADPKQAYEMLKDYVVYYHIKDCSKEKVEVPIGHGEGNYENMIHDLVVNRHYKGFMTLEPHTGKYAVARKTIRFLFPIAALIKIEHINKWHKVFARVDKEMGVPKWKTVTREEIVIWQYNGLTKMIADAEASIK